jgi:hypothetical protein
VNALIVVIASCGRHFFRRDNTVSQFEVDDNGRVWWVDKWRGSRMCPGHGGWYGSKFSEGGTLNQVAQRLRLYVMYGDAIPAHHTYFGPWKPSHCDGDLWGYHEDMGVIRRAAEALGIQERGGVEG